MKTSHPKPTAPAWFVIDAKGQRIGKVAVKAASVLRGKHKVTFSAHQLCGDHVIVINAAEISLPPKKVFRKTYYRHTGFPGNMKVTPIKKAMERDPLFVIENAVKGMLESNRLSREMIKRLHVFAGNEHNHEAQQPQPLPLR